MMRKLFSRFLTILSVGDKIAMYAFKAELKALRDSGEVGGFNLGLLEALIGVVVVLIVLGTSIPVLWPLATATSTNITAMSGTDAGTSTIKAFWPVILLVVGLALAVGLIVFGLKQFSSST